jgi:UrcA family protein
MKRNPRFLSGTSLAALLTAMFTFVAGSVFAQQTEEIVVKAKPRARITVKSDAAGRATETLTLERHISYADLDLSKYADVTELKKRIEINAREACDQLDGMRPIPRWSASEKQDCVDSAIDSGNESLQAAISATE